MARAKGKHYVNNKEFYLHLVENKKFVTKIAKLRSGLLLQKEKIKGLVELLPEQKQNKIKRLDNRIEKQIKNIEDSREWAKLKNHLGRIYIKICEGFLQKPNFINYTKDRKEEMISDATFFMSRYTDRYDTERTNPFAYFTTVVKHAFLQHITKSKKYAESFTSLSHIENLHMQNNVTEQDDWN